MSTDLDLIVILGIKLPDLDPEVDYDATEELAEKHGLNWVYDGMSGQYSIIGVTLASADIYNGEGFDAPCEIDILGPEFHEKTYLPTLWKIAAFLEEMKSPNAISRLKVFVLTHFH